MWIPTDENHFIKPISGQISVITREPQTSSFTSIKSCTHTVMANKASYPHDQLINFNFSLGKGYIDITDTIVL